MRYRKSIIAGVFAGAAAGLYALVIRPWHLRWGATESEAAESLPGDELMPDARSVCTHAITIEARPEDVWPWIVQIGQDRGGFYSYTFLENLVGCRMKNADRILPEFQERKVGDLVRFHPNAPPIPITVLEPERVMAIGPFWTFFLRPIGGTRTRLIVRGRGNFRGVVGAICSYGFLEPAHFIMERRMLLRIKELAESGSARRRDSLAELTEAAT